MARKVAILKGSGPLLFFTQLVQQFKIQRSKVAQSLSKFYKRFQKSSLQTLILFLEINNLVARFIMFNVDAC